MPETVYSHFVPPSIEVAVFVDFNLNMRSFCVDFVNLDLRHCKSLQSVQRILFGTCQCGFVPIHYFTQKLMNDRKIEPGGERCYGPKRILAKSIKLHFHKK